MAIVPLFCILSFGRMQSENAVLFAKCRICDRNVEWAWTQKWGENDTEGTPFAHEFVTVASEKIIEFQRKI